MYLNFSPAANKFLDKLNQEITFELTEKQLSKRKSSQFCVLKRDLETVFNLSFRLMNSIFNSNLDRVSKINTLTIIRDNLYTQLKEFSENREYLTCFEKDERTYDFFLENYSYLISCVDTKYKRLLERV